MYLFDLIKNNEKDLASTTCVEFYFITPLGSEQALLKEISLYLEDSKLKELKIMKGGVIGQLPLGLGLGLNTVLKIPVRILLRLAFFKARDLPKFYKKVSSLNWGKIFFEQEVECQVSATKCRLIHTDKLAKTFIDGIEEHRRKNPPKHSKFKNKQRIWIRGMDDSWLLSLDLTGDPLYKRGEKIHVGRASVRENLAAFLLQELASHLNSEKTYTLLDPMAGSGTFLLEADSMNTENKRSFSYQETKLNKFCLPLENHQRSVLSKFIGIERDKTVFEQLQTNCSGKTSAFTLYHSSFEDFSLPENESNIVCILNPPYGKRLILPKPAKEYYPELRRLIFSKFNPLIFGMLIPADVKLDWQGKRPDRIVKISNGGIALNYCIWMAKSQ